MIALLQQIREISSCRDRDTAAKAVARGVFEWVQPVAVMMFRIVSAASGPSLIPFVRCSRFGLELIGHDDGDSDEEGREAVAVPLARYPLLEKACFTGRCEQEGASNGHSTSVWSIRSLASGMASELLVVEMSRPLTDGESHAIDHFLGFYGNYLNLLDYSELDTLTGLNNRKTYDEALDRILAAIPKAPRLPLAQERRADDDGERSFWLGVVDIDHFKRINDNFGHLFGDEVLLRIASLMKQSFRMSDKLFRFGGEEFVVVLRPTQQAKAERAFERFRETVELHEFPQVGQVTCSVGFTRIDAAQTSTDTLGHADEALYFSKQNGRNQVNCYEKLVGLGLLSSRSIEASLPDLDIDALFA